MVLAIICTRFFGGPFFRDETFDSLLIGVMCFSRFLKISFSIIDAFMNRTTKNGIYVRV